MSYENWITKFFFLVDIFFENTFGKELIDFIFKLVRSGFMLYH